MARHRHARVAARGVAIHRDDSSGGRGSRSRARRRSHYLAGVISTLAQLEEKGRARREWLGQYARPIARLNHPLMRVTPTTLPGRVVIGPSLPADGAIFLRKLESSRYVRGRRRRRLRSRTIIQRSQARRAPRLALPQTAGACSWKAGACDLVAGALDVAVDLRRARADPSGTERACRGVSCFPADNKRMRWVPPGNSAHGFLVVSEVAGYARNGD